MTGWGKEHGNAGLAEEVKRLQQMIEELETRLADAQSEVAHLRRIQMVDEETGMVHRETFLNRLHAELRAAERYGRFLTLVVLSVFPRQESGAIHHLEAAQARKALVKRLGVRINQSIRETDTMSSLDDDLIAIMLVEAEEHNAIQVVRRLREETDETMAVRWALASYPSDAPRDDQLIAIARERLLTAQRSQAGTIVSGSVILSNNKS